MKVCKIGFLIATLLLLAGCAGPNPLQDTGDAAGFFSGLWHGLTVLFSFIGKLFGASVSIYEVHNTGCWYDFGFLIGAVFSGRLLFWAALAFVGLVVAAISAAAA